MFRTPLLIIVGLALLFSAAETRAEGDADYAAAAKILQKYCAGCHNADDRDGDLALDTFAELQKGGEHGAAVIAGDANSSRLIRVLVGEAEPAMPPEDNKAPAADEIQVLRDWIEAGAQGPDGQEPTKQLRTPVIEGKASRIPISDLAASPDGNVLARSQFKTVEVLDANSQQVRYRLAEHPGKVNSIRFSRDGRLLAAATGVAGLYGEAKVWDVETGKLVLSVRGHDDVVYAAVLSPDKSQLATCSYDRKILLWDVATGKQVRSFAGHNDAIYDLTFSPDGKVLASASGDETVKLWRVADGARLDTLGQPQGEQYVVRFSPDGKHIVAGGVDNRIRVWRFVSRAKPQINPLLHARFAHEGPIVSLEFADKGSVLLSAAEDRSLKVWNTKSYVQVFDYAKQIDVISAITDARDGQHIWVARLDGSIAKTKIERGRVEEGATQDLVTSVAAATPMTTINEQEPNDLKTPQAISSPATVQGSIHAKNRAQDTDVFRFSAKRGEHWIVQVKTDRGKSPLDSFVEVLEADGSPIPRVRLQAVRDSYFTFRGKDSNTIDDFRLHNWEEMELNEYLYCNGEVVKLWLYPRGPDSGFKVYPGAGKRYGFFDTTPTTHALQEPCYVVEPYAPHEKIIPNGLPIFTLFYENDDDSRRQSASDSRVNFVAPRDGEYLVRVSDVRGAQGESYKYSLQVRPAAPDFKVTIDGRNPTINAGGGKEFVVRANRIDGFDGEITVDISNLPEGFYATTPLKIEAGQNVAYGAIYAAADAKKPEPDIAKGSIVTASAMIRGEKRSQPVGGLGEIKFAGRSKVVVRLQNKNGDAPTDRPLELTISPGETIQARVVAERNGFNGIISFGKEDSGRNLPHGVFVDNIGLNGLMLREKQNERVFFITAAKWVPETTRTFHLLARVEGNQTTLPVILHVRPK